MSEKMKFSIFSGKYVNTFRISNFEVAMGDDGKFVGQNEKSKVEGIIEGSKLIFQNTNLENGRVSFYKLKKNERHGGYSRFSGLCKNADGTLINRQIKVVTRR